MLYGLAYDPMNNKYRSLVIPTFEVYEARGHSSAHTTERLCSKEEPNLGLWLLSKFLDIEVSTNET